MTSLRNLIFGPPYPRILFTGEKTKTFRVTEGEKYNIGDILAFSYPDGEVFARAILRKKLFRTFESLTESDWIGHERFSSEQEMYKTYSNWEGFLVGPETSLTILFYSNFILTGIVRTN